MSSLFSRSLATWAAETSVCTDEVLLRLARAGIIDTVACMIAGRDEPACALVRKTFGGRSQGHSSVLGSKTGCGAADAACINAVAAHVLDYDDNFLAALTHPSAVLVPALFAVAEERGCSGAEVIDAYIIGLEVEACLGDIMNTAHYARGWHATSTIGVLGAAVACARLLSLDTQGVLAAMSIASSMASGSKLQFGTMTKPLHAGLAARNGVEAALLAETGLSAHQEPCLGEWGFCDLFNGLEDADPEAALRDLGCPFAIMNPGLLPKRFACCGSIHQSLDALLELREQHGFTAEDVRVIETAIPDAGYANLCYERPKNAMEAKFSMQYCLAVALYAGKVSLADFTDEAVARPVIQDLLPSIKMNRLPTHQREGMFGEVPVTTSVYYKDGSVVELALYHAKGSRENPFTEQELRRKFNDCCSGRFSSSEIDSFYVLLCHLSQVERIEELAFSFRGGSTSVAH